MRETLVAALLALALTCASLGGPETLEQLKARLDRQRDPAERARTTAKIGPILLEQAAQAYREERYETGTGVLEEYLGYIRRARSELEASGRNARKRPRGFKEMEIHLRQATIQLDDLARAVYWEERGPVEAAKKEIEEIWEKLVRALFDLPPRPAAPPETPEVKKP